jgi:L-alanine-DL-glutamate epimerase-like enolase superfamily enzyme
MKISTVHVYNVDLPVVGGDYRMALSAVSLLESTIVEVITDSGVVGYGETCPVGPTYQPQHALGARAALEEVGPHLIGLDPRDLMTLHGAMEGALAGSHYAKAAIDIAAWDICGKSYGRRVCDLLGGATGDTVPTYYSISVTDPEAAAREALERQAQGFKRLQLKIGGRDVEEDIETIRRVSEVREAGTKLVADANRGLTARDAVLLSEQCRDISFVLEQPCGTLEEMAALRHRLHHPLYMDELAVDVRTVMRAISSGLVDGFGHKLTRVGGISAMRTIVDMCAAGGIPHTCDDSWGGDIIAAACVHVGATVASSRFDGAWIAAPYIQQHYDEENGPRIENGRIKVPTGNGLGIVPDVEQFGAPIMSFG